MREWLKILIILIILPLRSFSNLANFEGKIKILKEGVYDTLQIELSVKNDIVRIDEISTHNIMLKSYLVNLSEERIFALSYGKRLYTEVMLASNGGQPVAVVKTPNYMEIDGTKCYQWRVKDKVKNSEITYWVAPQNFNFIKPLVSILNRSQTPLDVLGQFPQVNGYLPLICVDRTMFRKVKETMRVVSIKPLKLPESLFVIPAGFREILG